MGSDTTVSGSQAGVIWLLQKPSWLPVQTPAFDVATPWPAPLVVHVAQEGHAEILRAVIKHGAAVDTLDLDKDKALRHSRNLHHRTRLHVAAAAVLA